MAFNALLWAVQGLLAILFLFAGWVKLTYPAEALVGPIALPVPFLRFIGAAEAIGALGLVLPGLLRMHLFLTPLAAGGLVIIMAGATVITAGGGSPGPAALVPLVVGLLLVLVAWGRGRRGAAIDRADCTRLQVCN